MAITTSKLLCLPRELRDQIWALALDDEPETFELNHGMEPSQFFYPKSLPPVAFIASSLFEEVLLVWLRARTINLPFNTTIPASFVAQIDKISGWTSIKSLSFTTALRAYQAPRTAIEPAYYAADLVSLATPLQHLTLTVSSLSVVHFDSEEGCFTHVKPMDEVLATLDFSNILRCGRLKTLLLYCCPTWRGTHCLEAEDLYCRPKDLFAPLCRWFMKEFAERGRDVKVRGKLDRRGKKWSEGSGWDWTGKGKGQ